MLAQAPHKLGQIEAPAAWNNHLTEQEQYGHRFNPPRTPWTSRRDSARVPFFQ